MTKKLLFYVSISVLMFLCFFNVLMALVPGPNPSTDPGEPGSGGSELWDRKDINCLDPINPSKEKTLCIADGDQSCTPQYCN